MTSQRFHTADEFVASVIPCRVLTVRSLARIKEERNKLALERIEMLLDEGISDAMEWLRIERARIGEAA